MNNTSTSEDDNGYVPSSMLSFVSTMENNANTSDSKNNKHSQVWDWVDYGNNNHHHQLAATPTPVVTATPPFLSNAGANPFLDCQSSLLPMPPSNFPFYSPLQPDFQHQHQPNGLIKMEDCSDMVAVGQIGLNLGHRTYFSSGDTLAIDRLFRRSRGLYQMNQQIPRCQAEGCKADLSGAKHYHRRHKVCEFHSKATVVVANGLQQRFCQQCSRFHVLGEFDEAKRSCRKRLADHNRRRRKPQPTTSQSSTDPSAPNNSTETSNDETKQQNQTSMNQISSRQICSTNTGTPISSCTAASAATVCTFATNSMCIDSPKDRNHNHHHHHLNHSSSGNDNKVTLSSNGPCLSLGGAEEGNFGFYSTNSYNHQSSRPFVVMSDDDNSHYHHNNNHMSTSSSSATYYHHSHHNFFNEASQSSPVVRPSDQSSDQQQHANQMQHLGQSFFEVDFM